MDIVNIDIGKLKPYEKNAKKHNQTQIDNVAESIKQFGMVQPVVVDKNNVVIIGHCRLEACKKLGMEQVPCVLVDNLTEEQVAKLRLLDNKLNESDWDLSLLNEELASLDFSDFDLDWNIDLAEDLLDKYKDKSDMQSLQGVFIVPPFSVLDTRKGYWQERKKKWLQLTGNLSDTRNSEFGAIGGANGRQNMLASINEGTSNFDPVLTEIVYKWFCVSGGKILDCFGGEQTKGVVAGVLGYNYTGVEIRQEQVDLNIEKTKKYANVKYICGDSNNIDKLVKEKDFDLCFTSPPYYDLEVYSKSDMSALGEYSEFLAQYKNIFAQCYAKMNNHSFLVLKVGEIRDKKTGAYRGFVADNIKIMQEIGFKYYNEFTLINMVGTAQLRAQNGMRNRKVVKLHQNVLVFYKGNLKDISKYYPELQLAEESVLVEMYE